MSKHPSSGEFGKRRAVQLPDTPPPKRSSHVALLVMGTLAVGGGAYALMPSRTCQPTPAPGVSAPPPPGMAAPAQSQSGIGCTARTSSSAGSGGGSSGYSRTHWSFFGGSSSSSGSSVHGPESSSSGVVRGGFGSFAHAVGFSSSS